VQRRITVRNSRNFPWFISSLAAGILQMFQFRSKQENHEHIGDDFNFRHASRLEHLKILHLYKNAADLVHNKLS